jgi:hypothetical protein
LLKREEFTSLLEAKGLVEESFLVEGALLKARSDRQDITLKL